jgi:hypothetical protein
MSLDIVGSSAFESILINNKRFLHILAASAGLFSNKSAYCYINGTFIGSSGRSHTIITITPSGTIKRSQTFDIFGGGAAQSAAFTTAFNEDDTNGNLIILITWDEPQTNSAPVYQFLEAKGFQKSRLMSTAYRTAWAGIYVNGRGPIAEESATVWNNSGSASSLGNEARAFAQVQATVIL